MLNPSLNTIDVNAYNLNGRNYQPQQQQPPPRLGPVTDMDRRRFNDESDDDQSVSEPAIRMDNPVYYQPQQQARPAIYRGPTDEDDLRTELRQNEQGYLENNSRAGTPTPPPQREPPPYEYYFQTKIRNTGFWGKVRLRRGTWMVIVGSFFLCISLAIISVFWAFWYHPAVNTPCRVLGITLLIWSAFTIFFGLLSNWLMMNDPLYKFFVGSPVRWSSWVLLLSIIAITVASDLITVYYTYWHTRFVNTPMIVVSLNLYFFGSIALVVSLYKTIKSMQRDIRIAKFGPGAANVESSSSSSSSSSSEDEEEERGSKNGSQIERVYDAKNLSQQPSDLNSTTASEMENGKRRDFRKKNVQLKPRNFVNNYPNMNNSTTQNASFNQSNQ